MDKKSIENQIRELKGSLLSANKHADKLKDLIPHHQDPAMHAMCNVIRTWLMMVEKQEKSLGDMVKAKFSAQ